MLGMVAGGAYYAYRFFQLLPHRQQQVATTAVRQSDVVVRTYSRGELRAVRSVTLTAPNLFGTVQVTRMASLGALAKEKDLVVEFDDSELLSRIEEKQLALDQTEEQIKKSKADLAIRNNQDQVELLRTRYSVRRAELEVKRNELLSAIDAKKNDLNLEEAHRRLKQLESDIKSRLQQAEAELAVLQEQKNKSILELNRERQRLMQVKLLAPMTGLVAIRQNRAGGFFIPGMQIPDIREGDQVQPGMPVADVLDLSELEVISRVGELDRANLREGQDVILRLDSIPYKELHGKIKTMSGTASANVFSNDPAKKFDVVFSVDMKELLSALGASSEQIGKVLATAEANRKKPVAANPFAMGGGGAMAMGGPGAGAPGGAGPGGGGPGGQGMAQFGGPPGTGGGQGGPQFGFTRSTGGAGGGGRTGGLTPEQRTKMRAAMQQASGGKSVADMNDAERAEFQKKLQAELKKAGIELPAGMMAGGRRGGGGGGVVGGGFTGVQPGTGYTQKDLDAAKLPPPPEEDAQLEMLLRPGMLADVEIIVEKIPNAVHVPSQALFEREGKPFLYIRKGQLFEERPVVVSRRTESTVVLTSGVKPGELVALADPFAKPGAKKGSEESKGGAMGALPGGKK